MKTRNFQEIYDFCLGDDTYRAYFRIPGSWCIKDPAVRKYYYGGVHDGLCRAGTFIYCQSMRQLERFLGGAKQDYYIHLDARTCREVCLKDETPLHSTVYVVVHIREHGVQIGFTHPFQRESDKWVHFTARSHRAFTREGIIAEVEAYISRHILLPPGRYRDLQMEHMVSRENFVPWYKEYRRKGHETAECLHKAMIKEYRHTDELSYGEARELLAASGIFFDMNCDEFEKDELTEQFLIMCNRR